MKDKDVRVLGLIWQHETAKEIRRQKQKQMKKKNKKEFFVVCDNIRSLENIGSIFRTSDALGVSKIYLCGICGVPPNAKISKTALGAEKTVPFEYHKQTWRLIEKLKSQKIYVVALEQDKKSIVYTKLNPKFPLALIIGNEVKGISP